MNWKKIWFGMLAIGIPLTLIAGQIRWYNDPGIAQKTVLTGTEIFSIQETSPNAYRWILANDVRNFTSGSATNPIQTLYVSNAFITNLYSTNIYSPNFYSSNIYTTNIEVRGKATINYINPVTNYFFFTTNLYLSDSSVSNYFVTNVFNNTYVSNYLQTSYYVTNQYVTNLYSTNIVNNNSYVSNFWQTNIFSTSPTYVSNYFQTNLYSTTVSNVYSTFNYMNVTNATLYGTTLFSPVSGSSAGLISVEDSGGVSTINLRGSDGAVATTGIYYGDGSGLTNIAQDINYYFFTTNLYLENNYVSNYFTTNVLNDTYISNYLQQTFYTTNIYTTNLFSTNIVNNNSYVSNFWATNIFVTDNFVSNYFITNMFITDVTNIYSTISPWTTNNLGEIFPSDANFTNVWTRKPNTVFGYKANAIGPYNSAFGVAALANNQLGGMYNTAIGHSALSNNATGDFNTAVGYESQLNVTGSDNTSFGWRAMWNVITGGGNTAIGESCMDQQSAISEATTVGYGSLDRLTGIGNCAFGFSAFLGAVGAGTNNIAIGSRAGELASSIGSCIFIGYRAGYGASSLTNAIGIGETATPTDNGQMVLGVGITNYVMGGISNFWPRAQNPGPLMNDGAGNLTYGIPTNVWANGPTGTVNLAVSDQNYSAGADMEITGVTGKGSTTVQNVLLTILATGANRTLFMTGSFAESTGATSYVCTNGVPREIWIRYTPALGGWTNVCSLPFYRP